MVLCLSFLFSLVSASYCPTYTCDSSLTLNVCAVYSSNRSFKLNSNGCQTGYFCSWSFTTMWAESLHAASPTGSSFPCSQSVTSTTTSTSYSLYSCGTKLPDKNFKNGQTVISCTSDSDCILVDNTTTFCVCPFRSDGIGICNADTNNDQVFNGYWSACGSDNTLTDKAIADYWAFYLIYWEYMQSTVSCMNIFIEATMLSDLQAAYDKAINLAAANNSTTESGSVAMSVLGLLALY